jgi:DNA-binding response OmpR family regulator
MKRQILNGRSVLVVETSAIIAWSIGNAFEKAGARVMVTGSLEEALRLVEVEHLSGAIIPCLLRDGDSSPLCERLNQQGIPYLMHTGRAEVHEACRCAPVVKKPAKPALLVEILGDLIARQPIRTEPGQ